MCAGVVFFGLLDTVIFLLCGLELEFADGFAETFHEAAVVGAVVVFFLVEFALLAGHLLLFSEGALAGARNLAGGRETRLWEALLGWELIVFDECLIVVVVEFVEKPALNKANLALRILHADGFELRWLGHQETSGGHIAIYVSR